MDSVALNSHYASRARPAPPRAPRRAFCTRACTSNCTSRRRNAPLESRMRISTSTGPPRPHHPGRFPSAPPRADPGPLTTTPGEKGSVRAAGTWSAGPSVMVCPSRLLVRLKGLGADDPCIGEPRTEQHTWKVIQRAHGGVLLGSLAFRWTKVVQPSFSRAKYTSRRRGPRGNCRHTKRRTRGAAASGAAVREIVG